MSQPLSFEFMLDEAEQVRVGNLITRRGRGSRLWRCRALPAILLLGACTRSQPLPLTELDGITRVEVRNTTGADSAHVIVTPSRIEHVVAAVRSLESAWHEPTMTLPAGDVTAVFYRDTVVVGVVRLGQNFVMARGREHELIRSATAEELGRLADALELPTKVIAVPPRAGS